MEGDSFALWCTAKSDMEGVCWGGGCDGADDDLFLLQFQSKTYALHRLMFTSCGFLFVAERKQNFTISMLQLQFYSDYGNKWKHVNSIIRLKSDMRL